MSDRILILDFGSQVTQLIARRVRENGVYSEIRPYNIPDSEIASFGAKAIILSGGPASVHHDFSPKVSQKVFELGVPVLGFDLGGVGEQLRDLFPQGAVAVGDRKALADRATTLLASGERPAPFDRYRLEQMQAATLAVYRELQEAPRP